MRQKSLLDQVIGASPEQETSEDMIGRLGCCRQELCASRRPPACAEVQSPFPLCVSSCVSLARMHMSCNDKHSDT